MLPPRRGPHHLELASSRPDLLEVDIKRPGRIDGGEKSMR
jgi:hypothetical protein